MKRIILAAFAILLCSLSAWAEEAAPVAAPAAAAAAETPSSMEKALTHEGARLIWRRSPAREADLAMPVLAKGLVLDSFVYRVRDRRRNDLLNFARVFISTTEPTQDLIDYYQKALGPTAQRSSKKQTGETFLTAGTQDDFRLVVITPQEGYAHLRLERVQRFTAPPRVFTAAEQRVLRVLGDIGKTYTSAQHVAYRVEERTTYSDEKLPGDDADVSIAVDFLRPAQLSVTVSQGERTPLAITTKDGHLEVIRPGKPLQRRVIPEAITFDILPELDEDPIARLMLHASLITPDVDYIALVPVKDVPTKQQMHVVLTYPDYRATQYLLLDLQKKLVLSSRLVVKEDGYEMYIDRTFTNQVLEEPAPGATTAPPDAIPAPAAVTGT